MSFAKTILPAVALATLANAKLIKFGVLTDLHLNPDYQADLDVWNTYCNTGIYEKKAKDLAPFGRPGCDSPQLLVESIMKQMKQQHGDLDVILVPGDLVAHGLSVEMPELNRDSKYNRLTAVIDSVSDLFETYFGSVIVLPTIGNNDTEYHYDPPIGANKSGYYDLLIKDWFTQHTGNKDLSNLDDIKSTLKEGGWYRVDIPGAELSVLSLNTLFYNKSNTEEHTSVDDEQLDWLEAQLSSADQGHKFIILTHIYETVSYYRDAKDNWNENDGYQARFFQIMETYKDEIIFEATGHDHLMAIRYSKVNPEDNSSANYLNKILFPSVTPGSYTNPAFSTFQYDTATKEASSLKSTFLKVTETFNIDDTTAYSDLPYFEVDFQDKFSLSSFSADSMADLATRLANDLPLAREFIFNEMGIDTTDENQVEAGLYAYKYSKLIDASRTAKNAFLQEEDVYKTLCVMSHSKTVADLRECIATKSAEFETETPNLFFWQ